MTDLIKRNLLPYGAELLATFPAVFVEGARQVGKSTFTKLLMADQEALFLNLDDRITLDAARNDPQGFINQNPTQTIVIDEIQRAPELILAIKLAVDTNRTPGRFLVTGSTDLLKLERSADSLAGRAVTIRLGGFSQGELNGTQEDFISRLVSQNFSVTTPLTKPDYVNILAMGGYPELRHLSGRLQNTWIDSYLKRVIQRDAKELLDTPNPDRLHSLLRLIAANQAGEFVKSRFADEAGLPASSINNYMDTLTALFLVTKVSPWSRNLTNREIGKPKMLVSDSALAMRLCGLTSASLLEIGSGTHFGGLLEGLVFSELDKQRAWSNQDFQIYHFRDRNGLEVDLIIELANGDVFGIEVKASQTIRAEHFRGLEKLSTKLGDKFKAGIVLSTATESVQYGNKLWTLPVAAIWQ